MKKLVALLVEHDWIPSPKPFFSDFCSTFLPDTRRNGVPLQRGAGEKGGKKSKKWRECGIPIMLHILLVASFCFVILAKAEAELGRQDGVLFGVVLGLTACSAALTWFGRMKFTLIDLLVLALIVWVGVSYFCIAEVNQSGKWMQFLLIAALYFNVRVLSGTGEYYEETAQYIPPTIFLRLIPAISKYWVLILVMICGLAEAVIGLRQVFGLTFSHHYLYKITGTFYNPGPYGGFLAVAMSMAAYYLMRPREGRKIWFYLLPAVTFTLGFIVVFATGSRAALLALAVCAAIIAADRYKLSGYLKSHKLLSCAVLAIALIGAAGLYFAKKGSADARLLTWNVMARTIAEKPLAGTGFGTFNGEYASRQAEYFVENPSSPIIAVADAPEHGFNEYLQIGMELGLPALLICLAILVIALRSFGQNRNPEFYGLLALAIFAFFSYPLSLIPFQILLVIFLCRAAENSRGIVVERGIIFVSSLLIIATMLIVRPYFNEKIAATKQWRAAKYFYGMELYEDCVKDYSDLYPVLFDNPRFMFEYGHILNKSGRYAAGNHILEEGARQSNDPMFHNIIGNNFKEMGQFDAAEKSYDTAFAIAPNRLYPKYLLMKLYADTDRDARPMAREVLDFKPKIESPATNDMKEEAKKLLQ